MYSSLKPSPLNHPKVEVIHGVNKFKNHFTPVISTQDRKDLELKMMLENESTIAATERSINDRMYIKTNNNPFSSVKYVNKNNRKARLSTQADFSRSTNQFSTLKAQSQDKSFLSKKRNYEPQEPTIVEQIMNLRGQARQKNQNKNKRIAKIHQIIAQSQNLSNRFLNNAQVQKIKIQSGRKTQNSISKEKQPVKATLRNTKLSKQIKNQKEKEIELQEKNKFHNIEYFKINAANVQIEQIIGIKEQNFFFNEGHKKINIFKCNNEYDELKSPFEQLNEKFFQFGGVIDKIPKIKIPILRQISKLGQRLIKGGFVTENELIDILDSQQISFKQMELNFVDVMSFASGRLTADILVRVNSDNIRRPKGASDSSSNEDSEIQIPYRPFSQHKKNNFNGANQQKQQIKQFNMQKLTNLEANHQRKCKMLKQKIGNLLNSKKVMLDLRIQDSTIHKSHFQSISSAFQQYLFHANEENFDIQKKVRKNKVFKDKTQAFMIQQMSETLKLKNKIDKDIEKAYQIQKMGIQSEQIVRVPKYFVNHSKNER